MCVCVCVCVCAHKISRLSSRGNRQRRAELPAVAIAQASQGRTKEGLQTHAPSDAVDRERRTKAAAAAPSSSPPFQARHGQAVGIALPQPVRATLPRCHACMQRRTAAALRRKQAALQPLKAVNKPQYKTRSERDTAAVTPQPQPLPQHTHRHTQAHTGTHKHFSTTTTTTVHRYHERHRGACQGRV